MRLFTGCFLTICGCLRLPAPCDGSSRACCVLARRGWARWRSRWSSCLRGTAALTLTEYSNTVGRHQRDTLDNAAKTVAPLARLVERLAHPTGRCCEDTAGRKNISQYWKRSEVLPLDSKLSTKAKTKELSKDVRDKIVDLLKPNSQNPLTLKTITV
ncbi:uncharacterized protein LOC133358647 isoform X2 [Lethenteron reissneri]|uniref:uncharacterized protein LOC133358647 isoform X2 n=1 Tax=Lethenteron reissneri TaxID=7753 RepID=UPI002AB797F4|nr:uncharacterized protein LOC133358647 isoform X2 [Lethenteron reissneri]